MTFTQKQITIAITLANNPQTNQPKTFAGTGGSNTLTVQNARTRVRIRNSGAPSSNEATVDVYGLTPSLMNQLSTLGMTLNLIPKNSITIAAGDVNGMTTVYTGTIREAYGDYNQSPDVPMHFECQFGLAAATAPAKASSFTGPTGVAAVMQGYAGQLGLSFENNGVSTQLSNPYFSGSLMTQIAACREHAGIGCEFPNGTTLAIFPKFSSRLAAGTVPLISKTTGMILTPSYTQQGILVRTEFNPQVQFFGAVQVQSDVVTNVNGMWVVHKLDHALDSQVPHGLWESSLYCYSPNSPSPVIPPP